jgi:hypothetical protein
LGKFHALDNPGLFIIGFTENISFFEQGGVFRRCDCYEFKGTAEGIAARPP